MEFNHSNSLMIIEQESFFDWDHLQDQLTDVPPLLSEPDGLPPLPESLDRFEYLTPFSSAAAADHFDDTLSSALVPQQYHSMPPPHEELSFDDIDLDTFKWDPSSSYGTIISDAFPLNTIADPNARIDGHGAPMDYRVEEERTLMRTSGRSRSTEIGFDEIRGYFYMPITRAAKEMNVGLTVLKKRCRELGIPRWPHRKMKSLKSLICNVQELRTVGKGDESVRREVETLEEQRRRMEENPRIQLTETTKKLRQFCFKANYKKRRGFMHSPYFDHHSALIQ